MDRMTAGRWLLLFPLSSFLLAAPPLRIVDARIAQTEDGPSVPKGTTFVPGEVIFFSSHFDGYALSPVKKVAIDYQLTATDPNGVPIVEPIAANVDAELSPQDKDWKPKIRQTILIPPLADSGIYKIRLTAKDAVNDSTASIEVPFEVRGRAVEPSATLVVRNFRFYRSEEDPEPLKIAAYRPGDSVWARFDVTGYKLGPGNQREVSYTFTVTAEDGRVMLPPGEPVIDRSSSFYPMRYVPCGISLNLQPTVRRGEYTIVVHAEDRIGMQTHDWKQSFRVE
jgi:hypothetical protein